MSMPKKVQCRRCGDINVGWAQSARTGKWYLAYAYTTKGYTTYGLDSAHHVSGGTTVQANKPHRCDPVKVEEFQAEIAGYAAARGVTVAQWWEGK